MQVEVQVSIKAAKEQVWKAITSIEDAANVISSIEKVEVLEKPAEGFIGFKWRETRTMFGKTATEVMWITDAVENEYYKTRAESHGAVYTSTISVWEQNGHSQLKMEFAGQPVSFGAKLMTALMGWMFKGASRKALQQDLEDIKAAVEQQG